MDLSDHRVLVTGGTRGIGLELARALDARGASVVVCGRGAEALDRVEGQLPAVTALPCDLSDVKALPAFVERLHATFGAPTVLVNNAGIQLQDTWPDGLNSDFRNPSTLFMVA